MQLIGYCLVDLQNSEIIESFKSFPKRIFIPSLKLRQSPATLGKIVYFKNGKKDPVDSKHALLEKYLVDPAPGDQIKSGEDIGISDEVIVTVTYRQPTAEEMAALKQKQIAVIKQNAMKDILEIAPEWKQRNMLAAAFDELLNQLKAQNITIDESPVQEIRATWESIKARREQSDTEEAEVLAK